VKLLRTMNIVYPKKLKDRNVKRVLFRGGASVGGGG
jgi:hypothetical protein